MSLHGFNFVVERRGREGIEGRQKGWQGAVERIEMDRVGQGRMGQVCHCLCGGQHGSPALFHNWSNHFDLDIQLHLNNIYMHMHTHIHKVASVVWLSTVATGHNSISIALPLI